MTVRTSAGFGASVLIFASLLFSSQLAPAQFTQQGPKLVGTGAVGLARQGWSVALSGDGNTAIVGGHEDNSATGAAWVYTRSGSVWTQQGGKLIGTGAVGNARQGISVALSGDGNTAIVGGPDDDPHTNGNSATGAAWVFTRTGDVWTQQGGKLIGTGAAGGALQGNSVALSADGDTAIVGGWADNSHTGAAWVYTRSGGVWTQQGSKVVDAGAVGGAQGWSVALSGDGNTAIVGGPGDNSNAGAAWVYTRSGEVWTRQGGKLFATGAVGNAVQGSSVALSVDGNTAIVGGYGDNSNTGAAWVYTRSGGVWTQEGSKLVGTGAVGAAFQGSSVRLFGNGATAIVGGPGDNSNAGAAWVYTGSGGVWTQQGSKLVGTGAVGAAEQS
jgi:FG-GAP repeat